MQLTNEKDVDRGEGSKHDAAPRRFLLIDRQQRRARRRFKNIVDAIARQRTALEVLPRADNFLHIAALLGCREAERLLAHFFLRKGIFAQVLLQPNEDNRDALTALTRLFGPLVLYVFERVGRVDGEADEEHVRLAVCERAQALVVFLAGGIPKRELHGLAVDSAVGYVVFEDSRDVALRVSISNVT
jgi:hypothetical protein